MKTNINPNHEQSKSQKEQIKDALLRGEVITPMDALRKFGTMKLTTRVSELIRDGFPVVKKWVKLPNGKQVMSYKIATADKQ